MMSKTQGLVALSIAGVLLIGCGRNTGMQVAPIDGNSSSTTGATTGTPQANPPQDQNQAGQGQTQQGQTQDSMLPKDITKIEISYKPAKPNPPTITRTITDPKQIAKIVDAINAVPRDAMGFSHCVADFGQQANMQMYPSSGNPITVSVVPSCSHVQVGKSPVIVDSQGGAWQAVQEVMGA